MIKLRSRASNNVMTIQETAVVIAEPSAWVPMQAKSELKNPAPHKIVCRQIIEADRPAVVQILARGFSERTAAYWEHALHVLEHRVRPDGCPRYGYVMTANGDIVGVVLMIFSDSEEQQVRRCNISSWYVVPEFRSYASLMISIVVKKNKAVYFNISPKAQTIKTIMMQGFSRYSNGVVLASGLLAPSPFRVVIQDVASLADKGTSRSRLLADHQAHGCISLICVAEGRDYPFVFLKRRVPRTIVPCAQLIYCENMADLVRFAGPLSRYLLWRGMPLLLLDANGAIDGLPGIFFSGRTPKYVLGTPVPRLGDLSYSEAVLFGP